MHPTAEKFSALYEELKGDIEGLVVKKEKQEAELAERQRQLSDLQASIDDITKRFEAERNEIAGDRQEFEESGVFKAPTSRCCLRGCMCEWCARVCHVR